MELKFIPELHGKSLPFLVIGIICGIAIVIDPYLSSDGIVYSYLKYAQITIDLSEQASSITNEHVAVGSISYIVVFLMILSSLHRAIAGCNNNTTMYRTILHPLADFLLSLNGALLGLFAGFALVATFEAIFLNGSMKYAVAFSMFCIIPYLFSFTIYLSRQVVSERFIIGKYFLGKVGDMIEGVLLIIIAILLLTFHTQFLDFYQSIPEYIVEIGKNLWQATLEVIGL
ncbi:hypothetical protein L1076_05145 [Vibrio sp. MMG022]|uniref:hypothetical protein n=1 Tax=Vibrio sp. MMG023 TaxID=2909979 RepID=UPI001F40D94C|nr:hypothetical protein [Vibrio sp. MMG023]MCF6450972.1 hypothetical protein [Vibrio sp. MMG023]